MDAPDYSPRSPADEPATAILPRGESTRILSGSKRRTNDATGGTWPREPGAAFGAAARIGRFTVLRKLGSGAMGVVVAAYDEALDRRVAVKLLHTRHHQGRDRMRREAQALARLSHPNVVQVYEIGEHEGDLYLAMEFAEGVTLRAWLKAQPRPWPEVLEVFRQVGRGLEAAHRVGLIHRDVKPANVLVGADGRVRVLDFGLARAPAADGADEPRPAPALEESSLLSIELTQSGTVLGTPAYMSPEQYLGVSANAQSDQFSFCVALFEALYRKRPFRGRNLHELKRATLGGPPDEPPQDVAVPRWIYRVVHRGLQGDARKRWPDMDALLVALSRDPVRIWKRRAGFTGAAALLVVGGVGIAEVRGAGERVCDGARDMLAGTWDDARASEVRAALLATGAPYAQDTWARVEQGLRAYADEWAALHQDACERHRRGERTGALLDLQMACLDQRRAELAARVDVLAAADAEVISRAAESVDALHDLSECADASALQSTIPPPGDALADDVQRLRGALASAEAQEQAGRLSSGLELAEQVHEEARALGYKPLLAEVLHRMSSLRTELGDYQAAVRDAREAMAVALACGHDRAAVDATAEWLLLTGRRLREPKRAIVLEPFMMALVERAGASGQAPHARALVSLAGVQLSLGEYERARERFAESLAIVERLHGADHPRVAGAHLNLAFALDELGDVEGAITHQRQALEIYKTSLGPGHPRVGDALGHLASELTSLGKYEESLDMQQQALAIREAALGPTHPRVAESHNNIGTVYDGLGRHAEAQGYFERALAIYEMQPEPLRANVALELSNLGRSHHGQGQHEEAERCFRRALELEEQVYGETHPNVAYELIELGDLYSTKARAREAIPLFERALAIRVAAFGEQHAYLRTPLVGLARCFQETGEHERAIEAARRALSVSEGKATPRQLGDVRFTLAESLMGDPRGDAAARAEALEQARLARDAFREFGAPTADEVEQVTAWLREHGAS